MKFRSSRVTPPLLRRMILARSQAPVRDPGAAARRAAPRLLGPTCDWHSSTSWAHCGRYRVARRTRVDENHDMGLVAGPRPDVVGAWLAEVSRCDRDSRDQELSVPEPGSWLVSSSCTFGLDSGWLGRPERAGRWSGRAVHARIRLRSLGDSAQGAPHGPKPETLGVPEHSRPPDGRRGATDHRTDATSASLVFIWELH